MRHTHDNNNVGTLEVDLSGSQRIYHLQVTAVRLDGSAVPGRRVQDVQDVVSCRLRSAAATGYRTQQQQQQQQ